MCRSSVRSAALLALSVAMVAPAAVTAQKKAAAKADVAVPVAAAPRKITTVEGITEYQLGNGMKVLMVPDATKPTVTVNLTVMVGSRHEGYGETGMAHLLEHMVFKGSPRHLNVPKELNDRGAQWNGSTWYDRTNYFEIVPSTDANLDWALDLEADRFVNSFIRQEDLSKEFTVVRNEFEAGENSPFRVLLQKTMATSYEWHNYGKNTIGNKTDIEGVPADRLQQFYRKYYQPDNAMLVVAGRFDEAKALKLVQDKFGRIPRPVRTLTNGMILHKTYTEEPTQDGERVVSLRRVGDVKLVMMSYHTVAGPHPDFPAVAMLAEMLGTDVTGRQYKALVDTKLATSTGSFSWAFAEPGLITAFAEVPKDNDLDDARLALTRTIEDFASTPVSPEELERARTSLLKSIELTLNKSEDVGIELSEWASMADWRFLFIHRDRLKRVSAADVQRVAAKYLLSSNRTLGMFFPTPNPVRADVPKTPDFSAIVSSYVGSETRAAGEAFDVAPAKIDARLTHTTLASGAKIHLLPKQTRGNTVNAAIELRYGSEASLQGKSTISDLASGMLERGTTARTRADLKDAFDKLKARVSFFGTNTAGTRATVEATRDNLIPALKLVLEALKKPSFPIDEFEKLRQENLVQLEQQRSEPQAQAFTAANRAVQAYGPGHPLYTPTLDEAASSYKGAKLDDVKAFHAAFYGAQGADVAVAGDFDAAAVKQLLTDELGNWTSRESYARIVHRNKKIDSVVTKLETPDKQMAMWIAIQPTDLKSSDPEWVAVRIGSYIFAESPLSARLGERLRQKEGLSYGAGGFLNTEMQDRAGTFTLNAIYNPGNNDKLVAAAKEELVNAVTTGFTDDEVSKAKVAWLQTRFQSRAEDRSIVGMMLLRGQYGLTFDAWDGDIERRVAKLSTADVNAAFRKYISADKVVVVSAGDFAGAAKKKQDTTPKP